MLDVFQNSAFSMRELTSAIQKAPHVPARLGELGLFGEVGIPTTTAQIEEREGALYLVPNTPRGAPAKQNMRDLRKMHPLQTVHLPIEDRITPEEIQNVRTFGSTNQLESAAQVVIDRLITMRQSLEATKEHLRIGAIKGLVVDSDGVTELYDLFSVFGVTAEADVDFDLDNASPSPGAVRQKCSQVVRTVEDNLGSTAYEGVHGMCGSAFFDALADHPQVASAYERWNDGEQRRDRVARRTLGFGGILFEEYRGSVGGVKFIADDDCHFFPVGSPDLFKMAHAPANFLDTANAVGEPLYARQAIDPAARWVDLYAQSNPLPYCTRPKVLIKGTRT